MEKKQQKNRQLEKSRLAIEITRHWKASNHLAFFLLTVGGGESSTKSMQSEAFEDSGLTSEDLRESKL